KFLAEMEQEKDEVGVATGMAWTPTGGDIIHVEATIMKGKGGLTLTGSLGDVMKESAQAALSYIRSKEKTLRIKPDSFSKIDIHIHVPSGAIPKDGPSAGITMACALASVLTGRPLRHDVAMTGEVTLRGRILPVGGLKEKILAAKRAGFKVVILPERNEKDIEEVPQHLLRGLEFVFAGHMDTVLNTAFRGTSHIRRSKAGKKNRLLINR
ncbi:MAG: S16 family serine protease, partial [Nitrospiria bacterium]